MQELAGRAPKPRRLSTVPPSPGERLFIHSRLSLPQTRPAETGGGRAARSGDSRRTSAVVWCVLRVPRRVEGNTCTPFAGLAMSGSNVSVRLVGMIPGAGRGENGWRVREREAKYPL